MVEMICRSCGKNYEVPPYRMATTLYCSASCKYADTVRWKGRPLAERFWEKVDKRGPDECWPWIGAKVPLGYGYIGVGRKVFRASRISYKLHYGIDPGRFVVRHTCDNPPCVNPRHLLLGTMKMNARDAIERGRHHAAPRKLTDEQIARIVADNGTCRDIAVRFGVSYGYVSMIRNRLRRA